jgi:4-hydroxyproline epimerase
MRHDGVNTMTRHVFNSIEGHTEGMPVRMVIAGAPALKGRTMSERREHFMADFDWIRRSLMLEPRGHSHMSGTIFYPPLRADSDFSLLFIETSGCLPMCGHATLGSITFALEAGLIEPKVPGTVVVDVPAGQIQATYVRDGDKVSAVRFTNVPSFLLHRDLLLDFPPLGLLKVDIAYGGNFYPIVEVQANFPGCEHFSPQQLLEWGREMQDLVNRTVDVVHPENPAIRGVKHCMWTGAPLSAQSQGRAVVIAGASLIDRSPCGTGSSARVAQRFARGWLAEEGAYRHESLIGSFSSAAWPRPCNWKMAVPRFAPVLKEGHGSPGAPSLLSTTPNPGGTASVWKIMPLQPLLKRLLYDACTARCTSTLSRRKGCGGRRWHRRRLLCPLSATRRLRRDADRPGRGGRQHRQMELRANGGQRSDSAVQARHPEKIPGWLLDQKGPLALRPGALPGILPWFLRFLACARHSKIVEIAEDMATLTHQVYEDYGPLLAACPDKSLLGQRPIIELFDTPAGLEHEREHLALRQALGFKSEVLDAAAISDLEPALAGKFSHGLLFPDWRAVSDTKGFIAALTQSFLDQGGVRVRGQVKRIDEVADRARGVTLADGQRYAADQVVIAAGTGSRQFFGQIGAQVPLAGIAGYQVLLPTPAWRFAIR